MHIDGQCHCGAIAYEAEIDASRVSVCHCNACQALTGSHFRVTALAARGDLHVKQGETRVYVRLGDSGRRRFQHFCGNCGSPLFVTGEGDNAPWGIRWGSINQRKQLRPVRQIWCEEAVGWIGEIPGLPAKQKGG
jgi:hypothetical protein